MKAPRLMDIPIGKLVCGGERPADQTRYRRLEASVRAMGLIEPLIVRDLGDRYQIVDGQLRHQILLDMGVQTVPCLIQPNQPPKESSP
jgi:ParB family chromosome partitioning protein